MRGPINSVRSIWPNRPLGDPRPQDADFLDSQWRSFTLGRHLADLIVLSGHDPQQATLLRTAGHHNPTVVATFEGTFFLVETQTGFSFFRTMTGVTSCAQQGLHIVDKIDALRGSRPRHGGRRARLHIAGGRLAIVSPDRRKRQASHRDDTPNANVTSR